MSALLLALEITALGMGLVFAAIILLWWMMSLLTRLMSEKEGTSSDAQQASVIKSEIKAQAAAIAVSVALAQQRTSQAHPLCTPPTAIVSAWQLGMRTRQLSQKGMPNARQVRKVR